MPTPDNIEHNNVNLDEHNEQHNIDDPEIVDQLIEHLHGPHSRRLAYAIETALHRLNRERAIETARRRRPRHG